MYGFAFLGIRDVIKSVYRFGFIEDEILELPNCGCVFIPCRELYLRSAPR